ncbi:MAG: DNA repair protein RadC [Verrucomicrobiales bacterium]|nr:DNA repair protein RadC [Verrucomicrobiales bacterium]
MRSRIQDIPESDRPRERLLRLGPAALSDAELLALFVNTGIPGENALQVAQRMLRSHGSLRMLSRQSPSQLQQEKALGPAKSALLAAAFELGRRAEQQALLEQPLETPEQVYQLMAPEMQPLDRESVRVLLVNTRHRLLRQEEISYGTFNEASAHPREILRPAILHNAYGLILLHNHPSGDPSPSEADIRLTRRIKEVAPLMRVAFLDHLIIGTRLQSRPQPYFSFRESGYL